MLFSKRMAEIAEGIGAILYADDILVGATTPEELQCLLCALFARLNEYGIKVNFSKVTWMSTSVDFLGCRLSDGQISVRPFLEKRVAALGPISSIKGIERIIGILSYCRRHIPRVEERLAPLRIDFHRIKHCGANFAMWLDVQ